MPSQVPSVQPLGDVLNAYGRIIDADFIERAVEQHVRRWFPSYINEVARQRGITPVPAVYRSYARLTELDEEMLGENQMPVCIITVPGISSDPVKQGNGAYRVGWNLGIASVVSAAKKDDVHRLVRMYAAAVRALILQHPSLGGFAEGVDWVDERYNLIGSEKSRSIGAAEVQFSVEVDRVLDRQAGPSSPSVNPDQPNPLLPRVQTIQIHSESREAP